MPTRRDFIATLSRAITSAGFAPALVQRMLARAESLGERAFGFFLTDGIVGNRPLTSACNPVIQISINGGGLKQTRHEPVHVGDGIYSVALDADEIGQHTMIRATDDRAIPFVEIYD